MSVNLSEVCKGLGKGNIGDKRVAIIIDQWMKNSLFTDDRYFVLNHCFR